MSIIEKTINADIERVEKLIEENPLHLSVSKVAEFLGISGESVRAAIECGNFGIAWRGVGKLSKAYCIPTAAFVRWYLGVDVLEKVQKEARV